MKGPYGVLHSRSGESKQAHFFRGWPFLLTFTNLPVLSCIVDLAL